MALPRNISGAAASFHAAAEASLRGLSVTPTVRNTPTIDLLAACSECSHVRTVQVKSNQSSTRWWLVGKGAHKALESPNLVYVFVNMSALNMRPDFFVVPGPVVGGRTIAHYERMMDTPCRDGTPRTKSPMYYEFHDEEGEFLEAWEHLVCPNGCVVEAAEG